METKAPRVEDEAAEPLPLDKLAPEVLNLIAEALAADEDVFQPRHLACLARSCKVIKEAVKDAKDKLKVEYDRARTLLAQSGWAVEKLCEGGYWDGVEQLVAQRPTHLEWQNIALTAADAPALTNVLKSKAVARVEKLYLENNKLGDEGAAAIAAAAAAGGLPCLEVLDLDGTKIGDAGMQALASAFVGGAFRELETLWLGRNAIGDAGVAALAGAFEKLALPKLQNLHLYANKIGHEGMMALVTAINGKSLSKVQVLDLERNELSVESIKALVKAIKNACLPCLETLELPADYIVSNPSLVTWCEIRGIELIEDVDE